MAIICKENKLPKTTLQAIVKDAFERKEEHKERLLRRHTKILKWYKDDKKSDTIAVTISLEFLATRALKLIFINEKFQLTDLHTNAAYLFVNEYISNLTRLDGSRDGPVLLLSSSFAMLECLSAGRYRNAHTLYQQMVQLLASKAYDDQEFYAIDFAQYGRDSKRIIPQRLAVFCLEMMAQREGKNSLPWEDWDIAIDKDYQQAAQKVYTTDMDEAARIVCQLCNLHIDYSNPTPEGDADDALSGFEFDDELKAIWPVEIFAWLRLRQEKGLPLPEVSHPLLDQPLGIFPQKVPQSWQYEDWFVELVTYITNFQPRYSDLAEQVLRKP